MSAIQKVNLRKYSSFLYVVLAVITAVVLRQIGFHTEDPLDWLCQFLRSVIYIVLFTVWGISVRMRIIQPQVRRYLSGIAALTAFWLTVRTIRFVFAADPGILRYLWYLYYLPMLFIPCLAVFVALSLGRTENFRLPKWTVLLNIPTTVLLLLVLTNDFHQLVFVFPADALVWGNDYHYAIGYFLAVGWLTLCALTALVIMVCKCRIPNSRRFFVFPFIPGILAIIYGMLYILRVPWLRSIAGDVTVVFCLLFTAALEGCIQCGLIPNNTGYDGLFTVSRLGAQIADQENTVCLSSANAPELTEEQRRDAEVHPVFADRNTQIKSHPIRFGHVLWKEDITELAEAIQQIEENCSEIAERNRIRQENLEMRKKILTLQEKNRVSNLLHWETARQMDLIGRMLTQYDTEMDEEKRRRLLADAAVVGAYIKRYGNLLLVSEHTKTADIQDLSRCFEESFVNLELLGVNCIHTLPSNLSLSTSDMLHVYHGFETVVEACVNDLHHVWISAKEREGRLLLFMEFVCDTDLSSFVPDKSVFSCEDGAYRFTFKLQKGGEQI